MAGRFLPRGLGLVELEPPSLPGGHGDASGRGWTPSRPPGCRLARGKRGDGNPEGDLPVLPSAHLCLSLPETPPLFCLLPGE